MTDYFAPLDQFQLETEIKRSRFIATLIPLSQVASLHALQAELRILHPKASHHCLAYVLGSPQMPIAAGSSDDGEPSGTAGKPMLNILQKRSIGDVGVVVTRYFGGIKLGAGGLIRAYGASVSAALDEMELVVKSKQQLFAIRYPYELETEIQKLLVGFECSIVDEKFSEVVERDLSVAESAWVKLQSALNELNYRGLELISP
jgi:uncharacterized YigZ family protein